MKKIVRVGAGIDIVHTTIKKVKPTFFALHCAKCEHLVSHEVGEVNFRVECKATKCDKECRLKK